MIARARLGLRLRPRGLFVPSEEVPIYLWNGWRLLDDCPGFDGALLAPPPAYQFTDRGANGAGTTRAVAA